MPWLAPVYQRHCPTETIQVERGCKPDDSASNNDDFFTHLTDYSATNFARLATPPRRSQFLTRLCSRKADPPSAQLFVGGRGAKAL